MFRTLVWCVVVSVVAATGVALVTVAPASAVVIPAGFPTAATTGPVNESAIPDEASGRLTSSFDGQVLENFHATEVVVVHDDVTIRNFRVTRDDPNLWFAIALMEHAETGIDVQGTVIEDGQIITRDSAGNPVPSQGTGINGSHVTIRRVDISYVENAVACRECVVEDNYFHDLVEANDAHNDGFQAGKGANIVIRNNTISVPDQQTSAIILGTSAGPIDNVLIEGNFLNGGAYTVYSRDKGDGPPTNVTITGNAFGRDYLYGILSADGSLTWTNNTWADTGETIDWQAEDGS